MLALENEEINLPQETYLKHSSTINGVKFTHRELDVIAFIISGRSSKKIAALLSISPRTVENHTRNIMMKLECNSREEIIDFIEKSGKFLAVKKHYSSLLLQAAFKKILREIFLLTFKKAPVCLILCDPEHEKKALFSYYLEKNLKLAGIKTSIEARESHKPLTHLINAIDSQQLDHIIYIAPVQTKTHKMNFEILELMQRTSQNPNFLIFLLTQRENILEIPQEFHNVAYVNFGKQANY
jgi:DNA-binding CsgD family transcriptional regulator